ncbi:MAG TPA: hypothetical protein DDX91_06055 [Ruminococcaceae bacterium]|nr:hypothetical protein [Oscillospiraceae bacterium]
MGEYFCSCCGRRLDRSEVRRFRNDELDEIYFYCRYCGGECTDFYDDDFDYDDKSREYYSDETTE